MFATTKQFLDYFNLESLQQLPPLSDIKDLESAAKELGFEAELAAARVLELPEESEEEASRELSEEEQAQLLAEEEAIALSQKPLDEILHPNGLPETHEEASWEEEGSKESIQESIQESSQKSSAVDGSLLANHTEPSAASGNEEAAEANSSEGQTAPEDLGEVLQKGLERQLDKELDEEPDEEAGAELDDELAEIDHALDSLERDLAPPRSVVDGDEAEITEPAMNTHASDDAEAE
jgi:segregation and condensation protein B